MLLPSEDSPRAAGQCSGAAAPMRAQAVRHGRVKVVQALSCHRTQVWHCTPRMAVYMISRSLLACLVCALKIEFTGRPM